MACLMLGAGLSLTVCPAESLLSLGAALRGLPAAYHWLAESRAYFLVGVADLAGGVAVLELGLMVAFVTDFWGVDLVSFTEDFLEL